MGDLLVIFGITGQQGGSVANYVLDNGELRNRFRIRGVTRDTTSPKALAFQNRGVELCKADWSDTESLAAAFQGAHTVFLITLPTAPNAEEKAREEIQGKLCVDVAVAAGVQDLIFSSLPDIRTLSNYRYCGVHLCNAKAEIEAHIRQQGGIRSAFIAPGTFMPNYLGRLKPKRSDSGDWYEVRDGFAPEETMPLIDIEEDAGKIVGAILHDFEGLRGKTLAAAQNLYSMEEITVALSQATGKDVRYKQISETDLRQIVPSPAFAESLIQARRFTKQFGGFYGAETVQMITMTKEKVKEPLTSFQDFLARSNAHDLELD